MAITGITITLYNHQVLVQPTTYNPISGSGVLIGTVLQVWNNVLGKAQVSDTILFKASDANILIQDGNTFYLIDDDKYFLSFTNDA